MAAIVGLSSTSGVRFCPTGTSPAILLPSSQGLNTLAARPMPRRALSTCTRRVTTPQSLLPHQFSRFLVLAQESLPSASSDGARLSAPCLSVWIPAPLSLSPLLPPPASALPSPRRALSASAFGCFGASGYPSASTARGQGIQSDFLVRGGSPKDALTSASGTLTASALAPASASAPASDSEAAAAEQPQLSLGEILRPDFPLLRQLLPGGIPLVYLDSGATSQKPRQVLEAMDDYYTRFNANVHRGVHTLSSLATDIYEGARDRVKELLNARDRSEIVFTRNASEAINLVAYSWGLANLKPGDEIVLTVAEHHSNLVPWQMVSKETGAVLKFAGLRAVRVHDGSDGASECDVEQVNVEELMDLISPRTRLVALHHVSNVLGSEMPVKDVVEKAHAAGALVLIDACQSVPHMPVDVQDLGVDFAVASAHKMLGPTGIGFLYARTALLSAMPPFLGGGEMIQDVFLDHSTFAEPPARFEAGTPAIAEAAGLAAAIDYLQNRVPGGVAAVHQYEMELSRYLYARLAAVPGVRVYGPPPAPAVLESRGGAHADGASSLLATPRSAALCAFNVEGVHPTDLSTFLDQQHGMAIRSGHHCAQPLHRALGTSASARVSLHCYNTKAEVDAFIAALEDTRDFFLGAQS